MYPSESNRLAFTKGLQSKKRISSDSDSDNEDGDFLDELEEIQGIDPDEAPDAASGADGDKSPPLSGDRFKWTMRKLQEFKDYIKTHKKIETFEECVFEKKHKINFTSMPDVNDFVPMKLIVFVPRLMGFKYNCIKCGHNVVHVKGWADDPVARRVVDLDGCFYIATRRMQCQQQNPKCGITFMETNIKVIEQLPIYIQELFPAVLTSRSGISKSLLHSIRERVNEGVAMDAIRKDLAVSHRRAYDTCMVRYVSACKTYAAEVENKRKEGEEARLAQTGRRTDPFAPKKKEIKFPPFVACDDPDGFGGFWPCTKYLTECYTTFIRNKEQSLSAQILKASLNIASVDHHHGMPKRCAKLNGTAVYNSLLSVMNEYEQVKALFLAIGTSHDSSRPLFKNMIYWLQKFGNSLPELLFTDKCCSDKKFFEEMFDSLKQDIDTSECTFDMLDLEKEKYKLVDTVSVCDNEMRKLEDLVLFDENEKITVGLDCEWTVDFKSFAEPIVSTLQLAYQGFVWVFHLTKLRTPGENGVWKIPESLKSFLEIKNLRVVGRQISGDISKLKRQYGVSIAAKEELGGFAKTRGSVDHGNCSLRQLSRIILLRDLNKDHGTRLSNWDGDIRGDQLKYAALDAHASLLIYEKLNKVGQVGDLLNHSNIRDGLFVSIHTNSKNFKCAAIGKLCIESNGVTDKLKVRVVRVVSSGIKVRHWALSDDGEQRQLEVLTEGNTIRVRSKLLRVADQTLYAEELVSPSVESVSTIQELTEDEKKLKTRVKLDIYHWFSRISVCLDAEHPLFFDFCRSLRDAVMILDENDKKKFKQFLKNKGGLVFEEVYNERPDYVHQFVRRYIPAPALLRQRILAAIEPYRTVDDDSDEVPLLTKTFDKVLENALVHVDEGCLSDPPGIQLYYEIPGCSSDLPMYRCVRGTNSNEGGAHKLLKAIFGSNNAGPLLTFCILLDASVHVNMKAAVRNKGETDYGHFDPWLLDNICRLHEELNMPCPYEGWIRTDHIDFENSEKPFFIIGPWFRDQSMFEPYDPEFAKKMKPSMRFLAERTGVKVPVVPIHNRHEMKVYKDLHQECNGNHEQMLVKWRTKVDGVKIFNKTYELLESHRKVRESAQKRNDMREKLPDVVYPPTPPKEGTDTSAQEETSNGPTGTEGSTQQEPANSQGSGEGSNQREAAGGESSNLQETGDVATGGESSNLPETGDVATGGETSSQAGPSNASPNEITSTTSNQELSNAVMDAGPPQPELVDATALHIGSVSTLAGPADVPNAGDSFSGMLEGCEMLRFPEVVNQHIQEVGESSSSRRAVTPEPNQNVDTNARMRSPRSPGDAPAKRAKVSNGKRKAKQIKYESSLHYHASRAESFMSYPTWQEGLQAVHTKFTKQGNSQSALFALKAEFVEKGYKSAEEVRTLLTEDNKQVKFKDWKKESPE